MIPTLSPRSILILTVAALWLATAAIGGWYWYRYTSTASTLDETRDRLAREQAARQALQAAKDEDARALAALQEQLHTLGERKQRVVRQIVVREPGDDSPLAPVLKRTLEALRDE